MSEKKDVTRREFMARSGKVAAGVGAAVLAGPAINVLGANEKLLLGVVGPGKRGQYLMEQSYRVAQEEGIDVEFIAVADIFGGWKEQGISIAEKVASEAKGYDHYQELLENKDVQGVIIATPEHLHAQQMIDAITAGKDIYAEKPMVHTIEEGLAVVKAANLSNCIVQVGTQRRSVPLFYQAREIIKNGEIGKVTFCQGWWHRNFVEGQVNSAWRYFIPEGASEENINWKEFLGPAPYVPFDIQRYFQWRCYWDYSNGIASDLMVHQLDAINIVMDTTMPKSMMSSGGIYRWNDGRTTSDTWSAILEYDEGFQVNYDCRFSNERGSYGIRICGSDGTIEIIEHQVMNIYPEPEPLRTNKELKPQEIVHSNDFNVAVRLHLLNWFECMKSRKQPNCDALTGFYASAIARMSVDSYFTGKRVMWDKQRELAYT